MDHSSPRHAPTGVLLAPPWRESPTGPPVRLLLAVSPSRFDAIALAVLGLRSADRVQFDVTREAQWVVLAPDTVVAPVPWGAGPALLASAHAAEFLRPLLTRRARVPADPASEQITLTVSSTGAAELHVHRPLSQGRAATTLLALARLDTLAALIGRPWGRRPVGVRLVAGR